jgi:hypothetical protein
MMQRIAVLRASPQTCLKATLNTLEVAKKQPKLKRVVITSSGYARIPFKSFTLGNVVDARVYTDTESRTTRTYVSMKLKLTRRTK